MKSHGRKGVRQLRRNRSIKQWLIRIMLVSLLVLLAGCSTLPGSNGPGKANQSITKSQVSSPEPVSAADKVAPGKPGAEKKESLPAQQSADVPSSAAVKNSGTLTRLWVTAEYGHRIIQQHDVPVKPGETVLDLMRRNFKVETAYGGGFIKSVAGITSGYTGQSSAERTKKDWFFYVNGILMDRGVDDYVLKGGETVWCDYHDWGETWFTPALVGAFPEPFRSGYDNSTRSVDLLVVGDQSGAAQTLTANLSFWGIKVNRVPDWSEKLVLERRNPTILLGTGDDLLKLTVIQDIFGHASQTGVFCRWEAGKFVALDDRGNKGAVYGAGSGCLIATGTGMGDITPLWIIAGVDQEGLEAAVDLLRPGSDPFSYGWNVLVTRQGIVSLPVQ